MRRLTELYPVSTAVEIYFQAQSQWVAGIVIGHQPPAIWVETADGRRWFVTNGRRIRLLAHPS